eukprot:1194873-Prorocentrum_minimum.AAC.7
MQYEEATRAFQQVRAPLASSAKQCPFDTTRTPPSRTRHFVGSLIDAPLAFLFDARSSLRASTPLCE